MSLIELAKMKLQKPWRAKANLGKFIFAGGTTVHGDINVKANITSLGGVQPGVSSPFDEPQVKLEDKVQLVFDDVHYSRVISSSMEKDLKFGKSFDYIFYLYQR